MSERLPLSVFIICHDEAERIEMVLKSISDLAQDIVVVDSGSTDGTQDIARRYTDRVIHRDWEGFGQQKVFAQSQCRFDWILNLDADEILLDEVKQSIRALFSQETPERAAAYSLNICYVSMFADSLSPHPLGPINVTPRLYDRNRAGFKDSAVHDKVETNDGSAPLVLKGAVAHISLKSFAHMWRKIDTYSALQAQDWVKKGRNPGWSRLLLDPPWFFLKNYFGRRYCFVGWEGFVLTMLICAGRVLRIAYTKELLSRQKMAQKHLEEA